MIFAPYSMSRWLVMAALLLVLSASSGCGIMGCQCAEPMGVKRTRPEGETTIAPQPQTGEPTTVTITIPPTANASLCFC